MTPNTFSIKRLDQRAALLRGIREFFWARGFLEVETPVVLPYSSQEPYLDPMRTTVRDHRGKPYDGFLRMSPEFSLKKLIAAMHGNASDVEEERIGGSASVAERMRGIFELGPVFRDGEPWGGSNNPEFTMLEWYRLGATYRDLMRDCETLVLHCMHALRQQRRGNPKPEIRNPKQIQSPNSKNQENFSPSHREGEREGVGGQWSNVNGQMFLTYQHQSIDFTAPWERLTMRQAWKRYARLNLDRLLTRATMARACRMRGYTVNRGDTFDDLFFKIHLTEVEPKLGRTRPTFLTDWPTQMAGLARRKARDPRYAERVELYIGGLELANGFSELTDADEQLARFRADQRLRRKLGKRVYPIDPDFIAALRRMPPTAGIALGIDRLVMLLTDTAKVSDVRLLTAEHLYE